MTAEELRLTAELKQIERAEKRMQTLRNVAEEVELELASQQDRWGTQDHPSIYPQMVGDPSPTARYAIPSEIRWKAQCDLDILTKQTNWGTIIMEEVAEAITACSKGDTSEAYREVVQVAAVAQQWAACILERISERDEKDGGF